MTKQQTPSDEEQELTEFRQASREIEAIRALEEVEFISDSDTDPADESANDDSGERQQAPVSLIEDEDARRNYWQAQGLVELEQSIFAAALDDDHIEHQRGAYYRLAVYHGRTLYILRSALTSGKQPLARAAMRNLATLHRAMTRMHQQAPQLLPIALVLDRHGRDDLARDLVVRALADTTDPVEADDIVQRVNALNRMGLRKGTVQRHLKDLTASGHIERVSTRPSRYLRGRRSYTGMDINAPSLRALVGAACYSRLEGASYTGLNEVVARQNAFRKSFCEITGIDQTGSVLFVDLVETLLEDQALDAGSWRHADLIGSRYPRPYQYEAYAVFRGYGYHGQLVEAPTGSGKTLIGMMCIQDWLKTLRSGQSILILVPTSNYQQQWTGELCYQPIGLRLSPEMVFSGTPNQLERFQKRSGSHPAIVLMTYTALAQAGSAVGKGGFDVNSIETFLQGANVQYVVLDEVHKVAENPRSVSADVTRLMLEWLHDRSLRGLIGFTGTAEAYRARFARLGLQLVYSIPIDELIAAGFVAPFAELGAPFSYSARERRIRELLDGYKAGVTAFMQLLGGDRVRAWLADIPLEQRLDLGHELLNMARGNKEWRTTLSKRLSAAETGGEIKLTELKMVSLIQITRQWSDADMAQAAGVDAQAFAHLVAHLKTIRSDLAELIYLPSTRKHLRQTGFSSHFDAAAVERSHAAASNQTLRNQVVKDSLASNIVGLYDGLSEWYRRIGEGRVETIKAVIEAERATREVSGVIIFDNARRIHWQQGLAIPGYEGLGGLYAELLGDPDFTPYAVLSSEQYLPYDEESPLPPRIATFIENELMQGEVARALFDLITQGLDWPDGLLGDLRSRWDGLIGAYTLRLDNVHAARPGDFSRRILRPMRRYMRALDIGGLSASRERMLSRMDLRNIHFADLLQTFFDYAIIARYFRQAKVAELEQVSGARQKFFVIPMSSGNRKLLMYDLTARIVDAESLPINMVIVSNWARTGWNVISPNVLIDATATRDVTAWQQLRGRAIRARRSWSNDCYRLIMALIGSQMAGEVFQKPQEMPDDVADLLLAQAKQQPTDTKLDQPLQALLDEVTPTSLRSKIQRSGLTNLSDQERTGIAIALMRRFNKVTHIFELVKAYGSTSQVTYDRPARVWQRRPNIAAKHDFETSVNPFSGEKSMGVSHAPLIYAQDPRNDSPIELEHHLTEAIRDKDVVIVSGWFGKAIPLAGDGD